MVSVRMLLKMYDAFDTPGFWYPYKNIFALVDELGIQPFTNWTQSSQYSPNGLEVFLKTVLHGSGYELNSLLMAVGVIKSDWKS